MKKNFLSAFVALALVAKAVAGDALPSSSPAREHVDAQRLERVYELVEGHVKAGRLAGANVLIARNGRIVSQKEMGSCDLDTGAPMKRDTIVRIYSMSKVVTSVAALRLFEQGKLQLDSPVTTWLPELKNVKVFAGGTADAPQLAALTNQITVRMLLNHTAGFTYDFFQASPVHELYKREDLWNSTSLDDFIGKVGKLPLIVQPGTAYNYSIGLDVLGVLIQRASGQSFESYVAQNITGPLKMKDTYFDVPAGSMARVAKLHELGPDGKLRTTAPILGSYAEAGKGIAAGGAGMFSTIGDYARFAQMLLNDGQLDGVRILSRKTMELARLNSLTTTASPYAMNQADGWGLFGAVRLDVARSNEPSSAGMFYWSGAATTHFFCDPKEKLMALVFCQHIPFDQHGMFTKFRTAVYQSLE